MGQAFPLLMDQIIQGRVIAREGHYRFIMAQKAEKTLHYVRPKNCRQSPKAKTDSERWKGREFSSHMLGKCMGSNPVIVPEILPCLLVCFTEEDSDFCVHSPDFTDTSETEKRFFRQDRGICHHGLVQTLPCALVLSSVPVLGPHQSFRSTFPLLEHLNHACGAL